MATVGALRGSTTNGKKNQMGSRKRRRDSSRAMPTNPNTATRVIKGSSTKFKRNGCRRKYRLCRPVFPAESNVPAPYAAMAGSHHMAEIASVPAPMMAACSALDLLRPTKNQSRIAMPTVWRAASGWVRTTSELNRIDRSEPLASVVGEGQVDAGDREHQEELTEAAGQAAAHDLPGDGTRGECIHQRGEACL